MYYLELRNLTSNVLCDHADQHFQYIKNSYIKIDQALITNEIKKIFIDSELEIIFIGVFQKEARWHGNVHADVLWDDTEKKYISWKTALNFNLTPKCEATMCWFKPNLPEVHPIQKKPIHNTIYAIHYGNRNNGNFQDNPDFKLLDSVSITYPTLVKTNIPHLIDNYGNDPRLCLSIRFKGNPTFEECVEKLKKFI